VGDEGESFWREILVEERRGTKLLRKGNRRGNIRRLGGIGGRGRVKENKLRTGMRGNG